MARHHGHLTHEEKKKIKQERKKLRKELKLSGITKRQEFEKIAQMLGLVIYEDHPRILFWWWRFKAFLKGVALWKYFVIGLAVLGLVFFLAAIANQKGNFLVTMTDAMAENHLSLSDYEDLSEDKIRLVSDVLKEVNAFSVADMPYDIDEQEGSHNMADVVAYTFWVTNRSDNSYGYDWYMLLNQSTQDVEIATWIMIFVDGEMTYYSWPAADGGAEKIGPYADPPMAEFVADPLSTFEPVGNAYNVVSTPYLENRIVAKGGFEKVAPMETHKFTVVIWVEGGDPDCDESLIGGHAGFCMKFTGYGDNSDIYYKYGRAETTDDLKRTGPGSIFDKLWESIQRKGCFGQ